MWLRIPTSHCSPATEDSASPSDALCQRLALSATWRGKLLRPQSWRLAWKTEGWRTRLSGLTLSPSQADCFVAAWLDSLAGSPARTSALQADKQELRESAADSSLTSSDSFASWNPSRGCFLRTSRQFSIFQQEQPFLENLPKAGSMRNGELFERPMLVDRTGESGRLCWPTAVVTDSNGARNETSGRSMASQHHSGTTLNDAIIKWPAPRSEDWQSCGNHSKTTANQFNASSVDMTLTQIAGDTDAQIAKDLAWPTPATRDYRSPNAARMRHTLKAHENTETSGTFVSLNADRGAHCFSRLGAQTAMWRTPAATEEQADRMSTEAMLRGLQNPNQQINLSDQARMWMTPNVPLGGRKNTAEQVQTKGKTDNGKQQVSLEGQTMHWPTPQARDVKSPDMEGSGNYERKVENGWTIDLNSAAANWPTPKARDSKSAEGQAGMMRNDPDLNVIASRFSLPVPPTSTPGGKSPSGSTRRLNPDFVDWLMGLPPGWTDYAPLETASYLSRVRSLLRSYLGGHAK